MGSFISKGVSLDDWGQTTKLSYTWYWILACIPFLSLEQLYLGSPKTYMMKMFLNMVLLGYPYFYEMFMATWARPQVEVFGSPNPFTYGIHVGGGRFAKNDSELNNLHTRPLLYTMGLVLGLFGGDSFVMGDYFTGFFRLFCTLTIILSPISFIWWAYKAFLYVFVTSSVYEQDSAFFGYPTPSKNPCAPGFLKTVTSWMVGILVAITSPIPFLGPLIATMAKALAAFWGFTVDLFGFIVTEGKAIAVDGAKVASDIGNIGADGTGDLSKQRKEEQDANREAGLATAQAGGALDGTKALDTSTALGALLTGTIGLILVSSIVLSWRRTYQNASANSTNSTKAATATAATTEQRPGEGDDVPPEPRGARAVAEGA